MLKHKDNPTGNVAFILFGALLFGFTAGIPLGYFAHLVTASTNNPNFVAEVQQK
jgi:hypothetical protein